jgi:3-phenylpropionate/trans-cinnamate dioxygenase ferredoxin subunit
MSEEFTRIGALAEVPEGELRAFEMSSGRACVGHSGSGVFAIGDECTHQGCSLSEDGELMPDGIIECTCHGSRFDPETGEPVQGPATDPVPVFQTRIVDGWIEIAPPGEEG